MTLIPAGPWDINPAIWDKVVIDDREWPGLATVKVTRANEWDTKKAKGSHNGEREFTGAKNATVKITIKFWTDEHWQQVKTELLPTLEPLDKTAANSHTLSHEVSNARKVKSFTVDQIDGPDRAETGIWTLTIDATEYRPPSDKNAVGTATGSGKGTGAVSNNCQDLANQYALYQAAIAGQQVILAGLYLDRENHDLWLIWPLQEARIQDVQTEINILQGELDAIIARQNEYGCNSASGGSAPESAGP